MQNKRKKIKIKIQDNMNVLKKCFCYLIKFEAKKVRVKFKNPIKNMNYVSIFVDFFQISIIYF